MIVELIISVCLVIVLFLPLPIIIQLGKHEYFRNIEEHIPATNHSSRFLVWMLGKRERTFFCLVIGFLSILSFPPLVSYTLPEVALDTLPFIFYGAFIACALLLGDFVGILLKSQHILNS